MLAVAGLGWLLLRVARPSAAQLSVWNGGGGAAAAAAVNVVAPGAAAAVGGINITTQQVGQGMPAEDALKPQGNPLQSSNSVITQGYGVGSHAPADVWGGIDIALDGNSDGQSDPQGTLGQPIYATHSGVVKLARDTWPAGNHIWLINDSFRTGYSHLQGFAVENGQQVQPGTLIAYVGSTGSSSGPHLHYDVWEMVDGAWVNRNPYDFGGADGAR
ncbi:MAG: M23 family metallopeptidase [Chloroflexales bacterium]|nr:M23 family metallopeptidase [Chloroflexales bacterium]